MLEKYAENEERLVLAVMSALACCLLCWLACQRHMPISNARVLKLKFDQRKKRARAPIALVLGSSGLCQCCWSSRAQSFFESEEIVRG